MSATGVIVSRQIGTARAMIYWLKRKEFAFNIYAFPSCEKEFAAAGLPYKSIKNFNQFSGARGDFMLTGTSLMAYEDAEFWRWANKENIPSIAFVDQWINYKERFTGVTFPNHLFVVDGAASVELKKDISVPSRIHIAGSPALSGLQNYWQSHQRSPQPKLVYFCTEPSSLSGGDDEYKNRHGFYDLDCLRSLIQFFEEGPEGGWRLKVSLHPLDKPERVQSFKKTYKNITLEIVRDSRDKIYSEANFIVGMRSFFLIEAQTIGIPTISLQINRKTRSGLTDSRHNLRVCERPGDLKNIIQWAQSSHLGPDLPLMQDQWTKLIQAILKSKT